MEYFLDDIGAEVEINPDEVEVVKKKKPRKARLLKKEEKKALLDMLDDLVSNCSEVSSEVVSIVSKEDHIHFYKERDKLWSSLQSAKSVMLTVVRGLTELFIYVFKLCQTGKDKYCRFQLEWHRHCSMLLKDQVDESCQKELSQVHHRWLGYCEGCGVSKDAYNPIMIAMCAAVFEYLMQRVNAQQKKDQSSVETGVDNLVQEEDGVYYRFGGAALAAMLHLRYDHLKLQSIQESKRESIKSEISVLKAIQCTDKSCVPEYLRYRDKGYMYFPSPHFIPFIKSVDMCVLEYTNTSSFEKYGSTLVEIATKHLRTNSDLERQFLSLLQGSNKDAVHTVFLEMTRKLCNTRIQEFLDVQRQEAAKKTTGTATLSGQNLRDKLLTFHVNPGK